MSDPSLPLQKALVAVLKNGAVCDGRIYDEVPEDDDDETLFPYATLGDCQVVPDKADCIDGTAVYPQIDVWTRTVGYPETKTIAAQIVNLLDDQVDAIVVEGFELTVFELQDVRYVRDPDGKTRHGILTFHGLLQRTP